MAKMKILGLIDGTSTPFDGQYVVYYDPTVEGTDPLGRSTSFKLESSPDPEKALDVPVPELVELWKRIHGTRDDGKPNRPLTAFSVEIVRGAGE